MIDNFLIYRDHACSKALMFITIEKKTFLKIYN